MRRFQKHPAAKHVPAMTEDEFKMLKADIQVQGLLVPIIIRDGMVLDGWHRYKACLELKIEPKFVTYE